MFTFPPFPEIPTALIFSARERVEDDCSMQEYVDKIEEIVISAAGAQ